MTTEEKLAALVAAARELVTAQDEGGMQRAKPGGQSPAEREAHVNRMRAAWAALREALARV